MNTTAETATRRAFLARIIAEAVLPGGMADAGYSPGEVYMMVHHTPEAGDQLFGVTLGEVSRAMQYLYADI